MSSLGNCRARRVLYERRKGSLDSIDLTNLYYNSYKKCYQQKTNYTNVTSSLHHQPQIQYKQNSTQDDEWIGDVMLHIPKASCTRFWLQNARGLPSSFDGNLFRYDLTNIRDQSIHYYAFPEAKINTTNSDITNHLAQIHQNVFGSGILTISNSPGYPKKSRHQPDGVASGFFGRLENRYART